jgi:aminoglycoside phosphotransferase
VTLYFQDAINPSSMKTDATDIGSASLPPELAVLVEGYRWSRIDTGCSAAHVHRLHADNRPGLYLKSAPIAGGHSLEPERQRLEWLQSRLPVPQVLGFVQSDGFQHLLLSEVTGDPAHTLSYTDNIESLVYLLAHGLRMIHALPADDCPFSHGIEAELAEANERMRGGLVDEDDFDAARQGRSAEELFAELLRTIPSGEEIVFTHGDYCMPNIIIHGNSIGGFIDMGRAGMGDRYRDLALAVRSIEFNYGREWVEPFLQQYGSDCIDRKKMEFFQLLDEFF